MQWILGSFFLFYFPFWLQLVSLGEGKWKIEIFKVKSILAINVARWEWSSRSKGLVLRLLTSVICISGGYMYTYVGGYFGLFFQDQRLYFWLFLVTLPVRLGIRAVRRILPPPALIFSITVAVFHILICETSAERYLFILYFSIKTLLVSSPKQNFLKLFLLGNVPILMPLFVSLVVLSWRTNDRLWGY